MKPPTIPVIIPAYRKPEQLRRCLDRLERQTQPVEVFVRDNSEDNLYFTAAVNEGLRRFLRTDCPAMLVLNQDMYLAPDAVEHLWEFMSTNSRCGIAAPIEIIADHPAGAAIGGGLEAFPWGRHLTGAVESFRHNEKVHWTRGVCMLLRREMIEEIGLLDRNLKFICSDSDYCLTARERGWQVWRVGAAVGEHEAGGASAGVGSDPTLEHIKTADALFFAKKWLTGDIYRKLSYEGDCLTQEGIAAGIRELRGETAPNGDLPGGLQPDGQMKDLGYYSCDRPEVLALVSASAKAILDIGCGVGNLGRGIKARQPAKVIGIEWYGTAAKRAAEVLDRVYQGDINKILPQLPDESFDTVIMADVLEHLFDTDGILRLVRSKLISGGHLILSLPNVGHWSVVSSLIEGRWDYSEQGLLDRTHVRFFTRSTAIETLRHHDFEISRINATSVGIGPPAGFSQALRSFGFRAATFDRDSKCFQYLIKAKKT